MRAPCGCTVQRHEYGVVGLKERCAAAQELHDILAGLQKDGFGRMDTAYRVAYRGYGQHVKDATDWGRARGSKEGAEGNMGTARAGESEGESMAEGYALQGDMPMASDRFGGGVGFDSRRTMYAEKAAMDRDGRTLQAVAAETADTLEQCHDVLNGIERQNGVRGPDTAIAETPGLAYSVAQTGELAATLLKRLHGLRERLGGL